MRKIILFFFVVTASCQFTACTSSPENYFNIAILGCNTMNGFANSGMERELASPSVQMIDGDKDKFAPMKRKEVLDNKMQVLTENWDKLKQLHETADAREVLQASIALYDYVMPVYNNEYRELARLYDDGASKESIESLSQSIRNRYYPGFLVLYDKLIAAGKPYAQKHNINVQWDIHTSPQ